MPNFVTLGVHLLCLSLLALPTLYLKFSGIDAYRRGFFCNDESISYPYKSNTVRSFVLGIVLLILSIFIIINEVLLNKSNPSVRQKNLNNPILLNIYICIGLLYFGAVFDQAITHTVKYLIGRLRPHFLSVCKPTEAFWNRNCKKSSISYDVRYVYINDTDCQQKNKKKLLTMRRSFPSGHASFSAQCAIAFSIYLYLRWKPQIPGMSIIRAFIQAVSIVLAVLCAASRVSDYMHHPTDVIAGFISGSIVAIICWLSIIKLEPSICINKEVNERKPSNAIEDDLERNIQ